MGGVNWNEAPEGAVCFAEGKFRNAEGNFWTICSWCVGGYTREELHASWDYEPRPDTNGYDPLQGVHPVCTPEATQEDTPYVGDGIIKSEWTATHYDNYYQLTESDIKSGKVRIDAYFVNKMWKLNQKDDTGGLFHSLKTIARFGEKNPVERELKALYSQTKRMAELYGVELE